MDNHMTVDQARYRAAAAQRELEATIELQEKHDSFPPSGSIFLLMASEVTFDQFVSYSEDGKPVGVFSTRAAAERYIETFETFEKPSGREYQIKELPLYR